MNKTMIAAALALVTGSIAFQSPASASPAMGAGAHVTTVAAHATPQTQAQVAPTSQPQEYPKYHDSQTGSYLSPPGKANPCWFTQAKVDGRMRQVEVCD